MVVEPDIAVAQVVEADKAWSIEKHAIEPIPTIDRHGTPIELFRLWIGANINYVVVVTGSLIYAKGLSFWQCMSAILIGNVLGCTVLGLCSIMGPKTGSAGIIASRTSFGQRGAVLPMAVSLVSALSWFSIQSVVATQGLEELLKIWGFAGAAAIWVALAGVLAAEILLALFGHATIIAAEKWIAVVLAILFAGLGGFVIPHVPNVNIPDATHAAAPFTSWLVAVGMILSYPIGWANFASDYSRYFPESMSWKKIAWCAGGGQFVALVFCQIIGVLFAMALQGALGDDPVSQLRVFLPTWFMMPLLLAITLGGVAANVPNGYTAALGMLALRIPISRAKSLAVIAVFTLIVRVVTVYYGQFYEVYGQFLTYLVFWTTPWAAIVITDYFMRGGRYNARDLMRWGGGEYWFDHGIAWAGIVAFVVGIAGSVAFSNSPAYESPVAKALVGGADLSFEIGLVVPALIYCALARRRLSVVGATASARAL
jgi:nucleobase:cation symporter-1, NCS1 family